MAGEGVRPFYPVREPFDSGHLKVSDLHEVYYQQSGNKDGPPIIFLHGGPGSGCVPDAGGFFNPDVYRIILMDQRGAGKSKPPAELRDNTTWTLVSDIEKLREHLRITKWVVFGGSWGSTLSLVYAQTHPQRVKALVLRGIFMLRRQELVWYYQKGASHIFPDHFEKYVQPIPKVQRHDLMGAYYRYLTGEDKQKQLECAKAWSGWEMATSRLHVDPALLKRTEDDQWALQFARIECCFNLEKRFKFRRNDYRKLVKPSESWAGRKKSTNIKILRSYSFLKDHVAHRMGQDMRQIKQLQKQISEQHRAHAFSPHPKDPRKQIYMAVLEQCSKANA